MKPFINVIASALAFTVLAASCKKDDTTTTTPTTPTTPTNTQGPQPPMPTPTGSNLSGALVSIKMTYTTQPTGSPTAVDIASEMGLAVFYDNPGSATRVDAGNVSVNNNALEKKQDNSYFKWAYTGATPSTLGFSTSSNWNVGGSSKVAAFSYDDTAAFPTYSGTVPTSVTKANGVTLNFNSGTITGADSVYVVIGSGDKSFTKAYKANAGSITISASDLQNLPAATNNTGVFEVCPFRYREVVKNGKNYFAIKELAVVRGINID